MPIVTISEYARMKGWVHSAVLGKIERGIISQKSLVTVAGKKKPRIDSERADLDIEFNGDEDKKDAYELHAGAGKEPEIEEPEDETINEYRDTKISHERLKARKLELEIAAKEGRLLDAEEVRRRITKLVTETKNSILQIPARVSPDLISIDDPILMESRLLRELNEALSNLSRLDVIGETADG